MCNFIEIRKLEYFHFILQLFLICPCVIVWWLAERHLVQPQQHLQ